MKSLFIHLSEFHKGGGGGIAMHRLRGALGKKGCESTVLCENVTNPAPDVIRLPRKARIEKILRIFTSRMGLNDIHRLGSFKVKDMDVFKNADVLNIHGTHHDTFSYLAFPELSKLKPTIFTMHDMWAFTGHCSQSLECDRWKAGCGKCPHLEAIPVIKRDGTSIEWKLKKWAYERSEITFVSQCKWLANLAGQSMISSHPIHCIPNGIDITTFEPLDPVECRGILGIPKDKKVLMFAAQNLNTRGKGGDLLIDALQRLPENIKKNIVILLLGSGSKKIEMAIDMPIYNFGYVYNDRIKALCYSAAHLFIHPTRADLLPIVVQESMACGTPVVSFDVGGVSEGVTTNVTGFLAEPEDSKGLSDGILQLLEDDKLRDDMSEKCRDLAVQEYSVELMAERYIELFNHVIAKSK